MHGTELVTHARSELRLPLAALALSVLLATACAPTLTLKSLEPGPVNLGGASELFIEDGQGRRSARELVFAEFEAQARASGHYRVVDHSERGTRVELAGREVRLSGGTPTRLKDDQRGMRVDVLEWVADERTRSEVRKDKQGREETLSFKTLEGRVLLAITVYDKTGRALIAEREYEGIAATTDMKNTSDDAVLRAAAKDAVGRFFSDVTPRTVARKVQLDDSDKGQETILKTAKAGNIAQAREDVQAYLKAHPKSAPAHYNLAVFLDASGEYAKALQSYDEALRLAPKDFYRTARADCARRRAAADALK